jgi:hypothetical protein
MCEPTTLTALAIASAGAGLYQQDQMAKATADSNQRQYDNTMTAYRMNLANSELTKSQEASATADKIIATNAQVRRDQAKATVAAGEAGVSGLSVDALLADLGGAGGRSNVNTMTNYENRSAALTADAYNVWSGAASQINSLKTPQGPDWLGAGLKIGTAIYDYNNPRLSDVRGTRRTT